MIRLSYIALVILVLLKLLHISIKSDFSEVKKKLLLSSISILSLFFLMEGIFMYVPKSHGAGGKDCLSARLWFSKYWEINSLGYRDEEIDPNDINKINIMIIGDSFVAGHGIKDPSKRFSNILQGKLSNQHRVYNLGLNGADTQAEYSKLLQFPKKPNLIILVHHPNDINRVPKQAAALLSPYSVIKLYASAMAAFVDISLVDNSYFLNYFYWKFNPVASLDSEVSVAGKEHFESEGGKNEELAAYLNESMFTQHVQNLYQFVLLSREESIPLAVVLFPETWDETIDFSGAFANKPIEAFMQREGIPVLDLYSTVKSIPIKERIVNNNDAHPSELTHLKVAEALHDFLIKAKLTH
ncbi:MAG: SGNH/GDSL hydrolase family protein [Nitrospinaceae bacterium]|nr:SGNH/GDSL hydrolase family protein [Nitrospinaceae bacterium]